MSPEEWYRSIPPVTKIYWSAAVLTTALVTIGALNPAYLYYDSQLVIGKFQIWRILTNFFFFGKFSMSFIFQVVMLVRYVGMLEAKVNEQYPEPTAHFLTMFLFGIVSTLVLDYFLLPSQYFYGEVLVMMCIYVWSRKDPFGEVNFYGFAFKQWHTPFLFLIAGLLMGGNPMNGLVGIVLGHAYFFLLEIVPTQWGRTLLWTPSWMVQLVKLAKQQLAAGPTVINTAAPRPGWQQGTGYRLG